MTHWYGIDVFRLDGEQRLGLLTNLNRVKAQKQIFDGKLEGLLHQGVYDLYFMAYEDAELAERARTQYLEIMVKAQCDAATNAS